MCLQRSTALVGAAYLGTTYLNNKVMNLIKPYLVIYIVISIFKKWFFIKKISEIFKQAYIPT